MLMSEATLKLFCRYVWKPATDQSPNPNCTWSISAFEGVPGTHAVAPRSLAANHRTAELRQSLSKIPHIGQAASLLMAKAPTQMPLM